MKYSKGSEFALEDKQVEERLPRYFVEGCVQHIIQRGNNRDIIFVADEDYLFYLECLSEASKLHGLKVHAYVLMTNHVHLLATPETKNSIPKVMQSVGRRYVQYFNHCYQRTGTLWEGRYKATVIDSDAYFLTCSRYIELNPVRANMVTSPAQYRWSSYAANAMGKENGLLSPHALYLSLGGNDKERRQAYKGLFKFVIPQDELNSIRNSTNKGWAMGDSRFSEEISELSERRTEPKVKGRPVKAN